MSHFEYRDGVWHCEDVPVPEIAAMVGTPFYVYSKAALLQRYAEFDAAFGDIPHIICYAMKANPNLALNRALAEAGCGAEVVSGGELFRAQMVGYPPERIVFDGNGKTRQELMEAIAARVLCINVDSEEELRIVEQIAREVGGVANIGIRVNPDVNPNTHPKIATGLKKSKFGVDRETAIRCYEYAAQSRYLRVVGIHAHIGSQIIDTPPFVEAMEKLINLCLELKDRGIPIAIVDMGGGIGIQYNQENVFSYSEYVAALRPHWERYPVTLVVEPGRSLVGNVGNLITQVQYIKQTAEKRFVIIDAAMNDLWRPTMYDAYHAILPVRAEVNGRFVADVVGGVCESGDFMARDREIAAVGPGDLLAIQSAGAYSASMSSEYNSRPLIPEVLVDGREFRVVRNRPTYREMVAREL
jgi:diaminopimelate decarboxylase